jgi:hypothetical protein
MDPTGVGSGDEKYQEHNEPNQGITGGWRIEGPHRQDWPVA